MFLVSNVTLSGFKYQVQASNNLQYENLEKSIYLAWVILQSRYENNNSDIAILNYRNQQFRAFQSTIKTQLSPSRLLNQFSSDWDTSDVISSNAITVASDMVCCLSLEQIKQLPTKVQNNIKVSLYIEQQSVQLIYNSTYHDSASVDSMADKFQQYYTASVEEQPWPQAPLASMQDIAQLKGFHTPVANQSRCQMDVIKSIEQRSHCTELALSDAQKQLSFEQFIAMFQQMANNLSQQGVTSGDRIGLYIDDRVDFVVAMFALLKLGASFVPLGTNMPKNRIEYIIKDAGISFVLIEKKPLNLAVKEIEVSAVQQAFLKPQPEVVASVTAESEAYIIYTSGSTGLPKGVCISRGSLSYYANTAIDIYQIKQFDRALQFSSMVFDAMIEEVFSTLIAGAALIIRTETAVQSIGALLSFSTEQQITVLNFPSAYWKGLIRFSNVVEEMPSSVRLVIIGGESVSIEDLKLWQQKFQQHPRLVNTYGPTETTVVTTAYYLPETPQQVACTIGRSIPGSHIYLIDDNNQIVPVGARGQICIGGPGLASGYINKDFEQHLVKLSPYKQQPIDCYKSGDYGRFLADGNIEFLGRDDLQLKVGGYRVNPDEINLAISAFSVDISDVKTISLKAKGAKANKLVTFVESLSDVEQRQLELHLAAELPEYMLPQIMVLTSFPKLVSGKTDIAALKQRYFDKIDYRFNSEFSQLENQVTEIWNSVLQLSVNDVDKSFFDYGANSIDTIHMLNAINAKYSLKFQYNAFLKRKLTIKNIAAELSKQLTQDAPALPVVEHKFDSVHFKNWRLEEASLDIALAKESTPPAKTNAGYSVVLTGANGFIGVHLLNELLNTSTVSHIYCLVRKTKQPIAQRILAAAQENQLELDIDHSRVTLMEADISQTQLGLSDVDYQLLTNSSCSIIHCAAAVNMHLDYESLKATNVESTRQLIELANTGYDKKIHHISSLAIFDCEPSISDVNEQTCIDQVEHLPTGYAQSKWVAEKLLANARELGISSNVYRCGRVWGNLHSQNMPKNDLIWKFIHGCIEVGYAPEIDIELDITPACFMAKLIVKLAFTEQEQHTFNLANPNIITLDDIYTYIKSCYTDFTLVQYDYWIKDIVKRKFKEEPAHALSSFEIMSGKEDYNSWVDSYFRGEKTESLLKKMGLVYPRICIPSVLSSL